MKKGGGKRKGSAFEREICRKLSLWWTDNKRDDVFWLTSGSGARATIRQKTNKRTFGQYGDIQATDPEGQFLLDICNIEAKRGYNEATVSTIIDKTTKSKKQKLEEFFEQAKNDAKCAESLTWWLIHKRDRKEPLLYCTTDFFCVVFKGKISKVTNSCTLIKLVHNHQNITAIKFDDFLKHVSPERIKNCFPQGKHTFKPNE